MALLRAAPPDREALAHGKQERLLCRLILALPHKKPCAAAASTIVPGVRRIADSLTIPAHASRTPGRAPATQRPPEPDSVHFGSIRARFADPCPPSASSRQCAARPHQPRTLACHRTKLMDWAARPELLTQQFCPEIG